MNQVVPGKYSLVITGTSGLNSAAQRIEINFVNPCPSAVITLKASPFVDKTYKLGEPTISQSWVNNELYSIDTLVDCGDIVVIFINDRVQTQVDPDLFTIQVGSHGGTENKFIVHGAADSIKDGIFRIKYEVSLELYPINSV